MRIKDTTTQTLADLPLLQASRLENPHFRKALAAGDFDPFPDGTQATGSPERRGSLALNSGITELAISNGPMSSFDGALPDHIQQALLRGVHNEDDSLRAFLAMFDRRLIELQIKAEKAAVLVATQDETGQKAASILNRLLRLIRRADAPPRYLKLLLPLLSRVRSLEGLRNLVAWWTKHEVTVTSSFDMVYPIDQDCLSRLSTRSQQAAPLGKGAVLGRFGKTPTGRISIFIKCDRYEAFQTLRDDTRDLPELRSAVAQYLREPVAVSFYADVPCGAIHAPRLSARTDRADRLGAYNMLNPKTAPDRRAFLKLPEIIA